VRWQKPTYKAPAKTMSLFDQSEHKKQEGIEAAYQGARSYWKEAAQKALVECAKRYQEFTTADVWVIVDAQGLTTSENRAMGAIMQSASRSGMIQRTGRYKETTRVSQHRRPIAIWSSNIYERNNHAK